MDKSLSERSCRLLCLRLAKCLAEQDEYPAKRCTGEARELTMPYELGDCEVSESCVAESDDDLEGSEEQGDFSPSNNEPIASNGNSLQGMESDSDLESGGVCSGFLWMMSSQVMRVKITMILLTVTHK